MYECHTGGRGSIPASESESFLSFQSFNKCVYVQPKYIAKDQVQIAQIVECLNTTQQTGVQSLPLTKKAFYLFKISTDVYIVRPKYPVVNQVQIAQLVECLNATQEAGVQSSPVLSNY